MSSSLAEDFTKARSLDSDFANATVNADMLRNNCSLLQTRWNPCFYPNPRDLPVAFASLSISTFSDNFLQLWSYILWKSSVQISCQASHSLNRQTPARFKDLPGSQEKQWNRRPIESDDAGLRPQTSRGKQQRLELRESRLIETQSWLGAPEASRKLPGQPQGTKYMMISLGHSTRNKASALF